MAITRDVVQRREVTSKVLGDGSVGYVRLSDFSDAAATTVRDDLAAHVAAGRTALILDLRGDPGGFVTAARSVASEFIDSGPIFWEQDARGGQLETPALPGGVATDPKVRVVCLIDGGSASASEIVAGALQDSKRATLVGQTSFGKGTVQRWTELTGEGGARQAHDRPLADAGQALDPRGRADAGRRRRRARGHARRERPDARQGARRSSGRRPAPTAGGA